MRNFFKKLNLIIPEIQNSLLPAFIFACAFLSYFISGEIAPLIRNQLHLIFWLSSLATFGILFFYNRRRPFFFVLTIILSYTFINLLKRKYNLDYLSTTNYINLCFFAPLNLLLFYFLHNQKLLNIKSLWYLMLMFGEIMIAEYLDKENIIISFNSQADGINLNSLSIILFGILLITAFIKCSFNGHIGDTAYFFGGLNIFAGFYYSASSTALSIFFAAAGVTILIGLIKDTAYTLKYDLLTGLPSRRYYLKDSQKFPFKYSLAVICLDNYVHIVKILGYFKTQKLIRMLANRLSELEPENPIYRYSTHEFILIFKNETLKNSFERLEQIRKEIASTEFMFSPKQKVLKITISACVSEKKRNDANATEVLVRAHRILEKAYQFTQNMISKA